MTDATDLMRAAAETAARRRQERERVEYLSKAAQLSIEVEEQFHNNGIVRFIVGSAHQEAVEAFVKLAEICATDIEGVRQLQNTIRLYSSTMEWLHRALHKGEEARKELDGATQGLLDDFGTVKDDEEYR